MTNSQRNETLNSVVGSKSPKIRFYGGSDSNNFCIACGIAQTNLRYSYVSRTLEALNIEPGNICLKYGQKMTNQVYNDESEKRLWISNGEELIAIGKTAPKKHEKKYEKGKRMKQELD